MAPKFLVPKEMKGKHPLGFLSAAMLDGLRDSSFAHRNLSSMERTLALARQKNIGHQELPSLESEVNGLLRQAEVDRVRQADARGESVYCDGPSYGPIIKAYNDGVKTVARVWADNVATGRGKEVLTRAIRQNRISARVANVGMAGLAYDDAHGKLTYLIPKNTADQMVRLLANNAQAANERMALESIATGHHEISEAVDVINLGIREPNDIVHHTMGLVGQVIGPTMPHLAVEHRAWLPWEPIYQEHRASFAGSVRSDASRLRRQLQEVERSAKGGVLDASKLRAAVAEHKRLYGTGDQADLRSAYLAYRITDRLRRMPERERWRAVRMLYSGRLKSEAELEEFIKGKIKT